MHTNLKHLADEEAMRVSLLIAGFMNGTLSKEQLDELDEWINASDDNLSLFEELTDPQLMREVPHWPQEVDKQQRFIWLKEQLAKLNGNNLFTMGWLQWTVAASIIVVAALTWYISGRSPADPSRQQVVQQKNRDIEPATGKALLTLSDGRVISLDNVSDSSLKEQDGTSLALAGGSIRYDAVAGEGPLVYNSISTPAGGYFKLQLADGSLVYLNAASHIRYPSDFRENERIIEITGEAYFEIAHNASKPFLVKTANTTIKVLGTRFNVSAYQDDLFIKTALAEGSVLVMIGDNERKLIPGQLAETRKDGVLEVRKANMDAEMAWRNNTFYFEDAGIETIMRQITRWYNVQVQYVKPVSKHFNATIPRNVTLSKVLQLLEGTGDVHFEIDGKTIRVRP